MKTNLEREIKTKKDAKAYLLELHNNGEAYHPDDRAESISWNMPVEEQPTPEQCVQLNKLMESIFALRRFDPYAFLLALAHKDHKE